MEIPVSFQLHTSKSFSLYWEFLSISLYSFVPIDIYSVASAVVNQYQWMKIMYAFTSNSLPINQSTALVFTSDFRKLGKYECLISNRVK